MSNYVTCCFTGRRPKDLCGYKWGNYQEFMNTLINYLDTLYSQNVRRFISGGAQGFDQMAFWAVDALRKKHPDIENIVYVPFEGQEGRWMDGSDAFTRSEYYAMLKAATSVNVLIDKDHVNQYKVPKYLLDRNIAMVNDSDFVIALYPGDDWTTNTGGTSHCMRYAKGKGKSIHQITYTINKGLHFGDVKII